MSTSEPVRVTGAADPVAVVRDAHEHGRPIALDTSGTTGRSRSVVRSTESWWASFAAYGELTGVDRGARLWVPGPMAATMNLFAALHADVVGAEIVERAEDATHACVTPAILARRLDELTGPTAVTVAGAPLLGSLADTTELAGHAVRHYYGAAELSFVAAGRDAESLTAFPGVRIEIRAGEIWVHSPYLAQRCADRVLEGSPEQPLQHTSDRLRRDGDWATAGDLGSWEHGRLVVTGRPDTVLTAGVTVVLAEVERTLGTGTTRPMACFGVDRPSVGQVLAAVVTDPTDVATLQRVAREALSAGHRPRLWFVAAELPLTGTGKVDRRVLAERAAAGGLLRG